MPAKKGRRLACMTALLLAWSISPGLSQAQDSGEDPEQQVDEAPMVCPCFEPAELTELPGTRWDLCLDTESTVQVARWFGRATPEGREGFNLIATNPSVRTMGGSCLLLRRFRVGGVLEQVHSNVLDLSRETAAACHAMLEAWLATRGGCQSEVAQGAD